MIDGLTELHDVPDVPAAQFELSFRKTLFLVVATTRHSSEDQNSTFLPPPDRRRGAALRDSASLTVKSLPFAALAAPEASCEPA